MTSPIAYVTDSAPFGVSDATNAMDNVFGQSNWVAKTFTTLVLSDFKSIWIDGSDANTAFPGWVNSHRAELETWVSNGGHLFLNAAPNYGPVTVDLGFNLNLINDFQITNSYSYHAVLTSSGQTALSGNNAASEIQTLMNPVASAIITDTVAPGDITSLIVGDDVIPTGDVLVSEHWGKGFVVAGGLTVPWDWQAVGGGSEQTLLDNIVSYALNFSTTIDSNGGGATANVNLAENETHVLDVSANSLGTVSYSITGGADAAKFQIDAATGSLDFINARNFENPWDTGKDNVYDVTITATDGSTTDTQALAVHITDVNETPKIDSNGGHTTARINVDENTTAVTTVHATDIDAGTTLTYSIADSADSAFFQIDAQTGVLSFVSAPDFETKADTGGTGTYDVTVEASDGTLTSSQDLRVKVRNVNEAPEIDSDGGDPTAQISIDENTYAVTKVHATDPDARATMTYSISGGADAALFQINATTGALSFIAAPNFDAPTDVGSDNVYDVTVQASDGSLFSISQAIAVTVDDVTDETLFGTSHADILTTEDDTDIMRGLAGDDTLVSGAGNDRLDGGLGADTMTGGTDDDTYFVNNVGDVVIEQTGEGTDTIRASISIGALADNVEKLTLTGSSNLDGTGNDLNNVIRGNDGDNQLYGLGGNDKLIGGAGNDTLSGGDGRDTLFGGDGQDTFLFDTALSSQTNVDWLKDFDAGGGDKIMLNQSIFAAFTHTGSLTTDEFYADAGARSAHDDSDRIIYDTDTGKLYYDADGIGGAKAVVFATLGEGTAPQLLFSDIAIYA